MAFFQSPPRPDGPAINAPAIVVAMIALMGGIHAARTLVLSREADLDLLFTFALIPGSLDDAVRAGGLAGLAAIAAQALGHMLLHGDWTHFTVNALWLLAFGTPIARRVGTFRFIGLFIVCGLAGAGLHVAIHWPDSTPMIGASGAISGIMAAAIRAMWGPWGPRAAAFQPAAPPWAPPVVSISLIWLAVNAAVGLFGAPLLAGEGAGIAWEAHAGGYLMGLFGFDLWDRRQPPQNVTRDEVTD